MTFSYGGKKYHTQQNIHTKFTRNVRRVDAGPVSKAASKKASVAPVYMVISDSEGSDEEDWVMPKASKKGAAPSKGNGEMEVDFDSPSPYPDATEASPIWDYMDPKTKVWTKFSPAYTKMVEGLSKRSAVFALNVPGLGGYQVILASMTMKATVSGEDTPIRRTPSLKTTTASPKLLPVSAATSSSSESPKSGKKKGGKSKSVSGYEDHEAHMFEVEEELISKCKKATGWKVLTSKEMEKAKDSQCVICCDGFGDGRAVVHLSKCGSHYFHENCIAASFKPGYISCPVCQTIYGIRTGTQPKGTMKVTTSNSTRLPGFESHGTITITYSFKDGIQEAHHPSPGEAYSGTSRTAYLPDNPQGNQVLKLLQTAFNRNLVFTIGTSVTTGASNCVIWNGIHHKTCTTGGSSNFGYPDDSYLSRVTDELKAKGVTLD